MKVTKAPPSPTSISFNTKAARQDKSQYAWWKAKNDKELADQVITTAVFLKDSQAYRNRQAAIYARMYGNISLSNFIGSNMAKLDSTHDLPVDKLTFNIVQSCVDTLVSKLSQSRPSPTFLTDAGDYKERNIAKQGNNFISGEFNQVKAYELATLMLRDALIEGTGCLKVFETGDDKVGVDRVLLTELLVDPNDAMYNNPRQLHHIKLVDRSVLYEMFPSHNDEVNKASQAYPDNSSDANKTITDQVMVVESWHLKSGKDAKDGLHTITCSSGILLKEKWDKERFPFVFMHYSQRLYGFWGQGLAEQLMSIQLEINSLLFTISRAIKLVGVPRIFVEAGSKVLNTAFNNDIGTIVKYQGVKPIYEVAPCVPQELYQHLERVIDNGYRQAGVSQLQAGSQKPAGLNSGEAIRSYEDISNDRFASVSKAYDNVFIDLAYLITDVAMDICKRTGKYQTVFPNKDGIREIELPKFDMLKNPFIIQCFSMSSLPREPAGRLQKVTEMIQSGMVSLQEGRRLLDFPDIQQIDKLDNAGEERIYKYLDKIVEDGEYNPPDPFMDPTLALKTVVSYYNLYSDKQLEPERVEMIRNWYLQVLTLQQAANPPAPPMAQQSNPPQAVPQPSPTSELLPNAPQG